MGRVIVNLRAESSFEYNKDYHYKLSGRIWDELKDTPFSSLHEEKDMPKFCFSNLYPYPKSDGIVNENDKMGVIISSPHGQIIDYLNMSFKEDDEFNVGWMDFSVESTKLVNPDVGEPGTSGRMTTASGTYVRVPEEIFDSYDVNGDRFGSMDVVSWDKNMSYSLLRDRFMDSLEWKFKQVYGREIRRDFSNIFDSYDYIVGRLTEVPIGDESLNFIINKWYMDYTVESEEHRRALNVLLDCGLGWRNALGFGFLNIIEQDGKEF
jgi:CRISPR-associated endoribonuclease Cas6